MTRIKSALVSLLIRLIGALPLSWARGLGCGIGQLCFKLRDRNTRVTEENLRLCYPDLSESEYCALTRASMCELGRLATEVFVLWSRSRAWQNRHLKQVYGDALMREYLAEGKGVLVLAPHLGDWEFFGAQLPGYGRATCMYQPPKQAYLEPVIVQARLKQGMHLVPTNAKGVAAQLKALKRGEIVGILPDQCPDMGGTFAPFFNEPAYTMTLIHGLVRRTGCRVLAGFAERVPGGFNLHFVEPDPEIYHEDEATSVAALNRTVENCVARCPEQYQWEYKRFRKQAPGRPHHYHGKI